jgi:hypothetical protein
MSGEVGVRIGGTTETPSGNIMNSVDESVSQTSTFASG